MVAIKFDSFQVLPKKAQRHFKLVPNKGRKSSYQPPALLSKKGIVEWYVGRKDNFNGRHNAAIKFASFIRMSGYSWEDAEKFGDKFYLQMKQFTHDSHGNYDPYKKDDVIKCLEWAFENIKSGKKRNQKKQAGQNISGSNGKRILELTDIGLSKRFASENLSRVRYCHDMVDWMSYDEILWKIDSQGFVTSLVKQIPEKLLREGIKTGDQDKIKAAFKYSSFNYNQSILNAARSDQRLQISAEEFDQHNELVNFKNLTYDLKRDRAIPHDYRHFHTNVCDCAYDPQAKRPVFDSFMNKIFSNNTTMIEYVQKIFGYCLSGLTGERCLFLFLGKGKNGKSTLLTTFLKLLGGYGHTMSPEALLQSRNGSNNFVNAEIAAIKGVRLIETSEISEGRFLNEAVVKRLTGQDNVTGRNLYQNPITFRPVGKIIIVSNYKPRISENGQAIYDRIRLVNFGVRIGEDEDDKRLGEKLEKELPGIANWALEGFRKYRDEGFEEPEEMKWEKVQYEADEDQIGRFLEERCIIHRKKMINSTALYNEFKEWCEENGEHQISQMSLAGKLKRRGFESIHGTKKPYKGRRMWLGIRVMTAEEMERKFK